MENSKLKYFIYYFLLLPMMASLSYLVIDLLMLHYLNGPYRIMHNIISVLLLAVLILSLTVFFNHKSERVKDFSRYVIVFHISFLFSSVLHFTRSGREMVFPHYYDFSFPQVSDVYHGTAVLFTVSHIIFFFIIIYDGLKFKNLHLVIFLLTIAFQYLMYGFGITLTGIF